jgi:hypothetical protein
LSLWGQELHIPPCLQAARPLPLTAASPGGVLLEPCGTTVCPWDA